MYKIVLILLILLFLFMNLSLNENINIILFIIILLLLYSLFIKNHYEKFKGIVVESSESNKYDDSNKCDCSKIKVNDTILTKKEFLKKYNI